MSFPTETKHYPLVIVHEQKFEINPEMFDVYVSENKFFTVKMPNITAGFLTLKTREDCLRLIKNPLSFYQNQFNMAVWFATTGCGISLKDHLDHPIPMVRSVYRFHLCYQIGKIFKQLQIPIPGEPLFNEINNDMNRRNLKELLSEFGLDDEYDFSVFWGWNYWSVPDYDPNITDLNDPNIMDQINKSKPNFLLMQAYENIEYSTMNWIEPPMFKKDWDKGIENLILKHPNALIKSYFKKHENSFESISQSPCQTYQQFMIMNSKKLTRVGIQRLNDTIRTYVYCVLGAQAQTRSSIVGDSSTTLDVQKQFLNLLDDSINKSQSLSLPEMIKRYDDAITHTHKRIDYAIGPDLYMIPSDLVFNMGEVEGYNNNITIATADMKFGVNDVNSVKITSKGVASLSGISD